MDNERPSEYRSWRHRLEEPGALPGAGLTDKEAAWDKLYQRLGETPRRRPLPWLWAAAACLLLALIPTALLFREKKDTPPAGTPKMAVHPKTNPARTNQHPTDQTQPRTSIPEPSLVIQNTPSPRPVALPHPIRRERPASAKTADRALAPIALQSSAPDPVAVEPSVHPPLPNLLMAPRSDLSRPIIAAQTTPKKELRVVHINELEPPQTAPSTAGPRLKPGRLYIGFSPRQDVLRPATTYETYQTDHPIISFKHSTQNP
ncbi:MAG: hypothetical protein J0H74_33505 [Chitinophagaceae bacterium]|nr:hypothetical protein [Chitinophagaceae bacterium]